MIGESLTTTGSHVLCRYCGKPIRFFPVTIKAHDATQKGDVAFLVPDYHEDCRTLAMMASEVFREMQRQQDQDKKKEIPYWVRVSRDYDRKEALRRKGR